MQFRTYEEAANACYEQSGKGSAGPTLGLIADVWSGVEHTLVDTGLGPAVEHAEASARWYLATLALVATIELTIDTGLVVGVGGGAAVAGGVGVLAPLALAGLASVTFYLAVQEGSSATGYLGQTIKNLDHAFHGREPLDRTGKQHEDGGSPGFGAGSKSLNSEVPDYVVGKSKDQLGSTILEALGRRSGGGLGTSDIPLIRLSLEGGGYAPLIQAARISQPQINKANRATEFDANPALQINFQFELRDGEGPLKVFDKPEKREFGRGPLLDAPDAKGGGGAPAPNNGKGRPND